MFLNSNCLGDSLNRKSIKSKHGIGVITIDDEDKLVVFGGVGIPDVLKMEVFNTETQTWELPDKQDCIGSGFSYLSVKNGAILSKLRSKF